MKSLETFRQTLLDAGAAPESPVKILFVPRTITDANRQATEALYASVARHPYDSVVVAESRIRPIDKKIPMPTAAAFATGFGSVPADDALRNDFCDEDDDFYIDDIAFGDDMALFAHLPYVQAACQGAAVVSVPVCDTDPAIVREFAYVLSEILGGRNALIVIPVDAGTDAEANARVRDLAQAHDTSNLFNLTNSGAVELEGSEVLIGALLIAEAWGLDVALDGATLTGRAALPHG